MIERLNNNDNDMLVGAAADFSGNGQHVPWVAGHEQNFIPRKKVGTIPLWLVPSGFPCGSAGKESACNAGDLGSIPGLGRSPGEGKDCPLQCSGLGNPMDCIVHGVVKSRTQLRKSFSSTTP